MVDLAMHMMDIVQNSISAGAKNIAVELVEESTGNRLRFSVKDDGSGMDEETINKLTDPFFTSRITRKVGLGVPFLKMTSEQTGGGLEVYSRPGKGTEIVASYRTDNPDCIPLGDLAGYFVLLPGANPQINFALSYRLDDAIFEVSTDMLREEGIDDFSSAGMMQTIKSYINEHLEQLFAKRKTDSYLC